jgi:hypothetical protein
MGLSQTLFSFQIDHDVRFEDQYEQFYEQSAVRLLAVLVGRYWARAYNKQRYEHKHPRSHTYAHMLSERERERERKGERECVYIYIYIFALCD